MYKNTILFFASILLVAALIGGCQKIEKGFISDNIYYNVNPFTVAQGITTVSSGLVIDGSTTPVNVKLLAIRELATGKDAGSYFLKPDTIRAYKGSISYNDSTLALLSAKLKDSAIAPFSINPVGGRLQFTQATRFVPIGQYTIDVQVSNIRGTKTLNNACKINVVGSIADSLLYLAYNHSDAAFTTFTTLPASTLKCKITRNATGPDKIIYVWKDKNGRNFNPANGEITGRPLRPSFADWDPYYPVTKTDTSLEFRYPGGVPQFPIFNDSKNYPSGYSGGLHYYSVSGKHTDIGMNCNTTFTINYYIAKGTFTITTTLTDVARIP